MLQLQIFEKLESFIIHIVQATKVLKQTSIFNNYHINQSSDILRHSQNRPAGDR